MTPEKYNRTKIANGFFTEEHIRMLVEHYQLSHPELVDDGCFGPQTRDALVAEFNDDQDVPDPSELALTAIQVALEEIGKGESIRNNAGEDVHRYRDWPHGDDFERPAGEWCAFFMGYVWEQAASRLDQPLPFARRFHDKDRNRKMPVGSALRLVSRMGNAGEFVVEDGVWRGTLAIGDVISLARGARGSGKGHVMMVVEPLSRKKARVIDGNSGKYPSLVKVRTVNLERMRVVNVARL
jgi:hypothetical protein